jgi:hypothetical protein
MTCGFERSQENLFLFRPVFEGPAKVFPPWQEIHLQQIEITATRRAPKSYIASRGEVQL